MILAALALLLAPNDICLDLTEPPHCDTPPCEVFHILRNFGFYCCCPAGTTCCPSGGAGCSGGYQYCGIGVTVSPPGGCIDSDLVPTPPVGWTQWIFPFDPNPEVSDCSFEASWWEWTATPAPTPWLWESP